MMNHILSTSDSLVSKPLANVNNVLVSDFRLLQELSISKQRQELFEVCRRPLFKRLSEDVYDHLILF